MTDKKFKIDIDKRTYDFALRVIKFVKMLPKEMPAQELGRQLLKSATSIAANVEEAQGAFSKEDFIFKMNTALKEAKESNLWSKLIKDAKLSSALEELDWLIRESFEIKNILGKIVKTSKDS